jgi:hypothetical protein
MSTASKPLPPPVAQIAAKFQQLRALDSEAGEEYEESLKTVLKISQNVGYAATTSKPRRGAA